MSPSFPGGWTVTVLAFAARERWVERWQTIHVGVYPDDHLRAMANVEEPLPFMRFHPAGVGSRVRFARVARAELARRARLEAE